MSVRLASTEGRMSRTQLRKMERAAARKDTGTKLSLGQTWVRLVLGELHVGLAQDLPVGVEVPQHKVCTRNHNDDSQYRNPKCPRSWVLCTLEVRLRAEPLTDLIFKGSRLSAGPWQSETIKQSQRPGLTDQSFLFFWLFCW